MLLSLDYSLPLSVQATVRPFLLEGRAQVLGPASPTPVVVAQTKITPNFNAYILSYGVTVRDATEYQYTGTLEFALQVNNAPFLDNNGNGSWTLQRGSVLNPIPTLIQLTSGGNLTFTARRAIVNGGPQFVDFIAIGFMIPAEHELCRFTVPNRRR